MRLNKILFLVWTLRLTSILHLASSFVADPVDPVKAKTDLDALEYCKSHYGANAKLVPNIEPNFQCSHFTCDAAEINSAGHTIFSGHVLARTENTNACGNGGRCRNGWCQNQGSPLTLDQQCMVTTGSPLAVHDARFGLPDVCKKVISCKNSGVSSYFVAIPAPGTPCGDNKIWLKEKCTQETQVQGNDKCMVKTGTKVATIGNDSTTLDNGCTTGVKCHYGTEFEYIEEPNNGVKCRLDGEGSGVCVNEKCIAKSQMSADEECILSTKTSAAIFVAEIANAECTSGIKCAFRGQAVYTKMHNNDAACIKGTSGFGICREGVCIEFVVREFLAIDPRIAKRLNVGNVCARLTSNSKAKVYGAGVGELLDRNQFCSRLNCTVGVGIEELLFTAKGNTPDGTTCGPLRRCKNGRCEFCDK